MAKNIISLNKIWMGSDPGVKWGLTPCTCNEKYKHRVIKLFVERGEDGQENLKEAV